MNDQLQTDKVITLLTRLGLTCVLCASLIAPAVNANENSAASHYENALLQIESREYKNALALLRSIQIHYPGFEKLSAVQTRIAVLQEADENSPVLGHYLTALDKRDAGDASGALSTIDFILLEYPNDSLNDDALYLKAYLQIMDRYEFDAARKTLAQLQQTYPDSSYQDSAHYLDAIALEQMGDTDEAQMQLQALRDKHTALSLPFGYSWPAGNVLSRYWFDRADRRINIIEKRSQSASRLRSIQSQSEDDWRVQVNVDGVDLEYRLRPSSLTRNTAWRDGDKQDSLPPAAGVFVGEVVGDPDSWVRAVIVDEEITGIAYAFGKTYQMQAGTLIGTLDYYQPRSAKKRSPKSPDAISTEAELHGDALRPPPRLGAANSGSSGSQVFSDLRVVPISIVVDAEFDRYHGGNGLVTALNQLNVADGIYRQFGLALSVDEVQVYGDNDANPMLSAPSTLEAYLNSFRGYRQDNRTLFNDSVLAYLFTGKQRTDRTLGLAWIDTLCRTDGYDVGITTPSAIGDVLLTHELGHSLGSQHDSDTSCNSDTSKIMWPNISSRTQVVFSDCSQESLSGARSKSCLVNAVDLSLNVRGSAGSIAFDLSNLDSTVAIDAKLTVESSVAGLLSLPAGCNLVSPTSAECAISALGARESRSLSFNIVNADGSGDAVVTGQLLPVGAEDFASENNIATYSFGQNGTSNDHLNIPSAGEPTVIASRNEPESAAGSVSKAGLLVLSLFAFTAASTKKQ